MKFLKMHGLGNDFVILDVRQGQSIPDVRTIASIGDRHKGVGFDQMAVLEPSISPQADIFMRLFNCDGSQAEACGNATRCVADIVLKETGKDACTIQTVAGFLKCRRTQGELIEVDMGSPRLQWQEIPLAEEADTQKLDIGAEYGLAPAQAVSMGNPHCVFFVDNIEDTPVEKLGPVFENHKLFPNRTNVEFAQILADDKIRLRTWERSAGLTLACGSAACATIVAAVQAGLVQGRKAEIVADGGSLFMEWRESDGHVLMTGPVAYVFMGEWLA